MNFKHRIIELRVDFNGIYEWGSGWTSAMKARWNDFFENHFDAIFWKHFKAKDSFSDIDHLVGTSASVYLHPMNFNVYIPLIGKSYTSNPDGTQTEHFGDVDELIEICGKLAEHCGGSIKVVWKKLHEFEDNGTVKTTNLLT